MGKVKLIPELRFSGFEGEWVGKNIGDVCEIKTGDKDTQNKQEEGLYPFFVRSDNVEKINTYSFDGEAILTSGDGVGVGKNFHYIVGKFDFHQRVYCLRNFKTEISGKYVYFVFSEKFYQRAIKYSAKNSVDSVRMEMISKMKLFFPSLPEQTRIATFLTSVDKRISLLTQKKEKLVCYKQGVMQKIFSQELRFKDEDGKDFPEWEEKRLGDVCTKQSSNISANSLCDNSGVYKIYGATGFLQYVDFYREEESYISIVKDGAGVGRVLKCDPKSSVLGTLDILKPHKSNVIDFLYLLLLNLDFTKYVTGSTIPHIYFKDYSSENISLPSKEEQIRIAAFLTALDQQIEKVDAQIGEMKGWKKGLLQKMFV